MLRQSVSSPLRSLLTAGPFSRVLLRQQPLRNNSTVTNAVAKATAAVNTAKATTEEGIYWSKVISEVAKQVYLKEGFTPPTVSQFENTYKSLYEKFLPFVMSPETLVAQIKAVGVSGPTVLKYTAYTLQILGMFSLGEIIGRRKLVGY
ncbi:mitochondrial ATP synthase g subunit-domain-containing protein [Limtongia smithiae]|uniref:mitochondrial ATP synthase g subunit-domain-containing protein n=1 Tax=Limtongia smithiae TaxID=1125753 RepID=UPI0034CD0AB8